MVYVHSFQNIQSNYKKVCLRSGFKLDQFNFQQMLLKTILLTLGKENDASDHIPCGRLQVFCAAGTVNRDVVPIARSAVGALLIIFLLGVVEGERVSFEHVFWIALKIICGTIVRLAFILRCNFK